MAAGECVALHRTYLSVDGPGKAEVESPKKLSRTSYPGATNGATIPLDKPGSVLAVTEGIETALAVRAAHGMETEHDWYQPLSLPLEMATPSGCHLPPLKE
jgi:hypothetical protein